MTLQAFGGGQRDAGWADTLDSRARDLLAGNDTHKIMYAEAAADTGHAPCGQHMIRSGNVIASSLRRELAEKNRARMLHGRSQRGWDCQVLGRDAIR